MTTKDPSPATKLNMRQLGFCKNIVSNGGNATKAYVDAGFAVNGAKASASRLLANVNVAAEVARLQAVTEKKDSVSRSYVIEKLVENVDRAMQQVPVRDRDGNETGEWTYQGSVANRALELLGKSMGMYKENVPITSNPNGQNPALKSYTLDELVDLRDFMENLGSDSHSGNDTSKPADVPTTLRILEPGDSDE